MTLWRFKSKLAVRWIRMVGWFLPVVLLFAAAAAALFCLIASYRPAVAVALVLLFVTLLHRSRGDLRLIASLVRSPKLHVAAEYLLLALPPALLLLLCRQPLHAALLLPLAPAAALLPSSAAAGPSLRRLRIARLGFSPEWCAYIRCNPLAVGAALCLAALSAAVPYVTFLCLLLGAILCTDLYRQNEPLQLLVLPETGAARLLTRKILTAWRNYFGLAAPWALAAAALHPRAAWLAAVWAPVAALTLAYIVLAKYAHYDPDHPSAAASLPAQLGLAGLLLPPLLPVTLYLTVRYALVAERNLNRYLHDYD